MNDAQASDDAIVARAIDLVKTYGDVASGSQVVALDHVSVDFQRGRMTAIMGPSGSGKCTAWPALTNPHPDGFSWKGSRSAP